MKNLLAERSLLGTFIWCSRDGRSAQSTYVQQPRAVGGAVRAPALQMRKTEAHCSLSAPVWLGTRACRLIDHCMWLRLLLKYSGNSQFIEHAIKRTWKYSASNANTWFHPVAPLCDLLGLQGGEGVPCHGSWPSGLGSDSEHMSAVFKRQWWRGQSLLISKLKKMYLHYLCE